MLSGDVPMRCKPRILVPEAPSTATSFSCLLSVKRPNSGLGRLRWTALQAQRPRVMMQDERISQVPRPEGAPLLLPIMKKRPIAQNERRI